MEGEERAEIKREAVARWHTSLKFCSRYGHSDSDLGNPSSIGFSHSKLFTCQKPDVIRNDVLPSYPQIGTIVSEWSATRKLFRKGLWESDHRTDQLQKLNPALLLNTISKGTSAPLSDPIELVSIGAFRAMHSLNSR